MAMHGQNLHRIFKNGVGDNDRITEQNLNHNHESLSDQNLL
jgi:hypothetical protein